MPLPGQGAKSTASQWSDSHNPTTRLQRFCCVCFYIACFWGSPLYLLCPPVVPLTVVHVIWALTGLKMCLVCSKRLNSSNLRRERKSCCEDQRQSAFKETTRICSGLSLFLCPHLLSLLPFSFTDRDSHFCTSVWCVYI